MGNSNYDGLILKGVGENSALIFFKLGDANTHLGRDSGGALLFSTDRDLDIESSGEACLSGENGAFTEGPEGGHIVPETADGTINNKRLCQVSSGDIVEADVDSVDVAGINCEGETVNDTDEMDLGVKGIFIGAADAKIEGGTHLKSCSGGRVGRFITAALSGTTMKTQAAAGSAFTNQPANDGIEILSDNSADTGIPVTIIGTTNGSDTVVEEVVNTDASDGTTPAASVKTDWGKILAVKAGEHAGTLTVREASADQAITTLATGTNSVGVVEVTGDAQRAFNKAPVIVSDSSTTKQIGLKGAGTDYSSQYDSQALTGATEATMNSAFNTVEEIYVGDLESARTITLKVGAADNFQLLVGRAGPDGAIAKDADCKIII